MAGGAALRGNSRGGTRAIFLSAAAAILAGDLLTKWLSFRYLDLFSPQGIIPGLLNLRLSLNQGAVFGVGQGFGILICAFTLVAAGAIVWAALTYGRTSRFLAFGLGCLLGGALGNLWDRLTIGSVRDFIDVYVGRYHWPTFNVADMAICAGAAILVIQAWRTPARREVSTPQAK